MVRQALAIGAALSVLGPAPGSASPGRPRGRAPTARSVPGELSRHGTDSGALELTLGGGALGVVVSLGVAGSLALATGFERRETCRLEFTQDCQIIRPAADFASAGLSFGLMVPLTVAAALLLRKGARIHRDYRTFRSRRSSFAWSTGGLRF